MLSTPTPPPPTTQQLGIRRGIAILTGTQNVALGSLSLDANTIGNNNTAIGHHAAGKVTTASDNTALGRAALYENSTGASNTAIGSEALYFNTTANNNTAVGYQAGYSNTTGPNLTALGRWALYSNTTGSDNTAVGLNALLNNSTGSSNIAVGQQALNSNTTSSNNTAVGYQAGYSHVSSDGNNVFIGQLTGYSATNRRNTFIGAGSGYNVTSGASNTILGRYNGNQGGLDIRTSSNNIVLSDGDGNPRLWVDSSGNTRFGTGVSTTVGIRVGGGNVSGTPGTNFWNMWPESNGTNAVKVTSGVDNTAGRTHIWFVNPNGVVGGVTTSGSSTSFNTSSDYRLKENVVELTGATDRLKQLNPSRFNFIADADTTVDGFLAHEVQDIVPEAITGEKDAVDADGNPVYQGIDQSKLVPLLVATIKELEARITALENA